MAKNIEMTPEQASLFLELKKLSKQANQRLLRLERETGVKSGFAAKQLEDYLSSQAVKSWTKKGRVAVNKQMSVQQLEVTIKATKQFLYSPESRVAGVKQYKARTEALAGKKLSYKQLQTFYKARKHYTWIYQYLTESEFWGDIVPQAKDENWSEDRWIDELMTYIDKELDVELKQDLIDLYYYAVG